MTNTITVDRHPSSAKLARGFVIDRLSGYEQRLVDDAALMTSELVTNSIRHATGTVTVTVAIDADTLRIAVSDGGPATPVIRTPSPAEPYGRGLQIVAALADDWGVTPNPDAGNTVWLTLRLELGAR